VDRYEASNGSYFIKSALTPNGFLKPKATGIFKDRNEAQIEAIAGDMASACRCGDLITLSGDLGAGKTFFARAFIRHYLGNPNLEVPSPTYLIAIEYRDEAGKLVTHMDLYRISSADELEELGFDEALANGAVLIEWPERGDLTNIPNRIDIDFEITGELTRTLKLSGSNEIVARYQRSAQIGQFLRAHIDGQYSRQPFAADASARSYERIETNGETRILMDAPRMPDGPPVKDGLPYSQIAHLAEEVRPFVAIGDLLRSKGFCSPQIYAHDCDRGLVLLQYLGEGAVTDADNLPIDERYIEAGKLLAAIHATDWPRSHRFAAHELHEIPLFDEPAMMIETDLLSQWYLEGEGFSKNDSDLQEYHGIWAQYCDAAQQFRQSIVLRDYHSPNIIWQQAERTKKRIGLIDFQDAMIGPAVYDLVSLAQDARTFVSPQLEKRIVSQYLEALAEIGNPVDEQQFNYEYALMGAQRACKLLGIFVRLDIRDGKHGYRKLIPGIRDNLKRNLQHPQLSDLRKWCERVIDL